jgi:hypothetical protein
MKHNERKSAVKPPSLSKALFWDCDRDKLDYDTNKRFILERVFTRGLESDELEVFRYYGVKVIKTEVTKINYLDKRTLNYLSFILKIPPRRFKCYKKSVSQNPFGMF